MLSQSGDLTQSMDLVPHSRRRYHHNRSEEKKKPDTMEIRGIPPVIKPHRNCLTGVLRSDTLLG